MPITHNHYGEFKQSLARLSSEKIHPDLPPSPDPETARAFISGLFDQSIEKKRQKRAAGRCMPLEKFRSIAEIAAELARRRTMDFSVDVRNQTGEISLTFSDLSLDSDDAPELLSSLSQLISCADSLFISIVEKYDEPLMQLRLSYDLE